MNALRNAEYAAVPSTEEQLVNEVDGDSRKRGVDMLPAVESAPNPPRLQYKVVHRLGGRLRLRVSSSYAEFHAASERLAALTGSHGLLAVRSNRWCKTIVVEYSSSVISEEKLFDLLDNLALTEPSPTDLDASGLRTYKEPVVLTLFNKFKQLLNTGVPGWLQVALGIASFASGALHLPVIATQCLLIASTAPIAARALHTALEHRGKLGIDALDGMAASVMIANGKLIEAGFMTALIGIGEFIRERTTRRCEQMVTDLLGLSGRSAWLIRGDKRICIPADEVKVGETVVVYPGDMVPVDGIVISGDAAIDQSKLTGESLPVEVATGSTVFASTVAVEGKIYVRCEAVGAQTKAGLVLQCVSSAPIHETKIQNYASNIGDKLVVPIFIASGLCFAMTHNVSRLMSMLILDFCTGIRIAAPTAVLSSMHRAGRRGILIKSGAALERLASVTAIVFDKTGTLTSGEPKVEEITRFNGRTEDEVLALAAAVEMRLHHPAARAIVKAAQQRGLTIQDQDRSEFARGMGAKAIVGNHEVIVGSKSMMVVEKIEIDETLHSERKARQLGESVSYVAVDGKIAGLIRYKDKLRPEVSEATAELKKLGVKKLVMATGDTEEAAKRIADCCGITEVIAKAFPEDKAELVKRLKAEGHTVAVIGDGINDSPALAYADVAISLHGATDAARHGADIVLTDDDLSRLPEAIRIARSAMALVKQNLAMAIVPNAAGFGFAAFGALGPAGATLLNNGSAIAAAINSLRPLYSDSWSTVDQGRPDKIAE